MRTLHLFGSAALLLAADVGLRAEDEKDRTPPFAGAWVIVAGEKEGKKEPAERIEGTRVRITRDTIVVTDSKDQQVYVMEYQADLGRRPNPIRMTLTEGPHKGRSAKGIIQLQDDGTLHLAYAFGDDKPPTEFATRKGTKKLMFVMKRAK
jgi:uncharacterized protein (TIGR03067 family)